MKIEWLNDNAICKYEDIDLGECFIDNNSVYMKIGEGITVNFNTNDNDKTCCVDMLTGVAIKFSTNRIVQRIKSTLTLER